jgi:hypothetical protein
MYKCDRCQQEFDTEDKLIPPGEGIDLRICYPCVDPFREETKAKLRVYRKELLEVILPEIDRYLEDEE